MGKISNYVSALKAKLTDYFVIASNNNGVLETKKVTTEQIGDAVASDQVHSSLNTSDKTLIGGINEVNSNVGALSALTTTDKSSLVGAVNEVNGKTTMSTGALTGAVSAVSVSRGNFWQLEKMIFACGAFTLSGSANAGLSLIKFPTGVSVPSAFDMVCFGADNKTYNCYAYLGNIVANTTMPAQVYTFNFVARTT